MNPPYEKYTYGQNGPFEYTWKQTVDYQTAIARTKFINNPLEFLNKFWGIDYNQDVDSGNKSNQSNCMVILLLVSYHHQCV